MKKRIIFITILATCIITAFAFAGCKPKDKACVHTYDNACDVICNECGEERMIAGHNWVEADCTTPKTCTVCGATEGSALGHTPEADDGDCTTAVCCLDCELIVVPAKENHVATAFVANCVNQAICDHCESPFGELDPNNHVSAETLLSWVNDEYHEERYQCCNALVKTELHNGEANCMQEAYCIICERNYGDFDMTNHDSENYTYTDNGDGTYKKLHECGAVMEEAHTFQPNCACGDEIVITKMTLLGEDFAFDESTNTYTKNSIEERVAVTLIFHGKNLKYVTAENVLQMLQINLVASFSFGELSMVYNEHNDTLTVTDEFLVGGDMVFKYSNDGGITWENGCVLSTKRVLGISVNECDHGNVMANANAVEGECVTLNITANAGYKLKSLIVKDTYNNDVSVENNQFIMPSSAVTVSAVFICEEECTFVYKPNTNQATHKKVCSVCDYVEIESEAHTDFEYEYIDNGDGTHERIWKCCNASIFMEHEFSMETPCVCGAAAIGITGLLFVANEVYMYDKETRTYTVIIPHDKSTANIAVQLIGNSLEYLQSYNDFIKVRELYCDAEEYDEYELGYLINDCGLVLEWIDRTDGVWVEYHVSNDAGENWTKYKVEVKQSYSIIVDDVENGTITVSENKTSTTAGDTITLIATPDAGYQFEAWVVSDVDGNTVVVENDQIIMPASAITIRAVFKEKEKN